MKRRIEKLLILAVSILFTNCAVTNVRLHPELVNSPGEVEHITIIPPIAYVELLDMGSSDNTDTAREMEIAGILENVAPKILEILNYNTTVLIPDFETQNNIESERAIGDIWSSYIRTLPKLYPKGEKTRMSEASKFQANIPMDKLKAVHDVDTDAVLLIRYSGFKQSGGRQASIAAGGMLLGLATGYMVVPIPEVGKISAALISYKTGNILWSNHTTVQNYSLNGLIAKLFLNFPEQSENLKHKIEKDEAISHQFDIKKLNSDILFKIKMGKDQVVLNDSLTVTGDIVKISKKEINIARGRNLYIMKRENIVNVTIDGILKEDDELGNLKYPRLNYNYYKEVEDID